MNPFIASYDELSSEFGARGIVADKPGFCDEEAFLAVEASDPHYLNNYAAFIAKRPYGTDYLARAKTVIDRVSALLCDELQKHGRLGACVDITGILFRMLEEEGIWSCCIKGSLTITFPRTSGITPRYFWSSDHGNFIAGHAWLFAPPYTVVDISAKQQPYKNKEREYIPLKVLSTLVAPVPVETDDVVSPSARMELIRRGLPPDKHLAEAARFVPSIFSSFPPIAVNGLRGAVLKYVPVAVHAPQEKLAGITNMMFRGMTPLQLYQKHVTQKAR